MRIGWIAVWIVLATGVGAEALAQTPFRPVATVNKSLITAFDVDQRARLLGLLGADARDPEALGSLALDRLIEDRLKLQAAEEAGLATSDEVVEAGLREFTGNIGTTPEVFMSSAAQAGITEQAVGDLVASQVLWREVVTTRFRGRVEPGEADIDAEIQLATQGQDQRLRLREIGLPADGDGRSPEETRRFAEELYVALSAGADFEQAVRDHSRAPSAERGGDLGWVDVARLPPDIARLLAGVPVGGVAPPRQVSAGYSILRVVDRETTGAAAADPQDPELRDRVRAELTRRRLDLLAQGFIQELRRDAMIDLRR
ncbi:MAG: peptidylprolyl isomerase [Pseudomonadota bacterium]